MLSSPNAIPPRTSSTGLHSRSSSLSAPQSPPAAKPILKPVSEGDWLAQKQQQQQKDQDQDQDQDQNQEQQQRHPQHPHTSPLPPSSIKTKHQRYHSSSFGGAPDSDSDDMMQPLQLGPQPPLTKSDGPPPPDPSRYAHDDLDFAPSRSWTNDKERVVRGPFDYVTSHPGKDFRSQLIAGFNAWLEVPPERLSVITRVVGMLHESSLLVDDVQDSSELRRGFPVAHSIFGVAQTINSANYIYFTALHELSVLPNSHTDITTFAEELVNLHRGQGMDLFWRDTLTCPTEDDYLEMVGNKTGGLFRLGIKLMQTESPHKDQIDCVPLVNLIGLIFQIRDDYMNLSSNEYESNKGMCEDLTEGKFSFPVIHSIRADPTNLQLTNILKQKTADVQVKRYAVSYMERMGSFEYTRKVLSILIDRARKTAEQIDAGRGKLTVINKILDKMAVE